ncbi:MAG: hypothetical protein EOP05_07460 [Proteobacteria bacterium]|nr:MAG: hypothetical protein EOP05_07460 [Pseudomonadota bacterium]
MNQALDAAKKAQLREGQIAEIQMEVNKLNMKSEVLPMVIVTQPVAYVPKIGSISKTEVGL